ncbi:MAG: hypothetical protein AB7O52_10030 [Planctomycetota bacterium]
MELILHGERRRRRRKRRSLTRRWLAVVLGLPLVAGLFLVANLAFLLSDRQIEVRVAALLTRVLRVEHRFASASFGPFSGLTVRGLVIANPPGSLAPTAVSIEEIRVTARLLDLLRGRVTLREVRVLQPHLHLERLPTGALNVPSALLAPTESGGDPGTGPGGLELPEIDIEGLEVHVCSTTLAPLQDSIRFPHLRVRVANTPIRDFRVEGLALGPGLRHVRIAGSGNLDEGRFQGTIGVERLQVDEQLGAQIPLGYRSIWDRVGPHGLVNLDFQLEIEHFGLKHWESTLEVIEGRLALPEFALELESLRGRLRLTPTQLATVDALTGVAGHGEASLVGVVHFAEGEIAGVDAVLGLDEVSLGPQWEDLLSGEFLALWQDLAPEGRVGLRLEMRGEGLEPEVMESRLLLHDVDVGLPGTPYRLVDLRGAVRFDGTRIRVDEDQPLRGNLESAAVKLWGSVPIPLAGAVDLHVGIKEFPLNQNFAEALPPLVREHYVQYGATGLVDIDILVQGEATNPEVGAVARVRDGTMKYELFPYELTDIEGEALYRRAPGGIDGYRDVVTLRDVSGRHAGSPVRMDAGAIRWGPGHPHLDLTIRSPGLAVDEDLIRALPHSSQDIVRSFHLDGKVSAAVEIFTREPTDPDLAAPGETPPPPRTSSVEVRTTVGAVPGLRFRYEPLPYELTLVRGRAIHQMSTGDLHFDGLETDPRLGPRLILEGTHEDDRSEPGRKRLSLSRIDLLAWQGGPGLPLDDKLLRALPPSLRDVIQGLKLTGHVSGRLSVRYQYSDGDSPAARADAVTYTGSVTGHGLGIDVGVAFRELEGQVRFQGSARPGVTHTLTGTGQILRGRFSRFQVQDLDVNFAYGFLHEAVRDAIAGTFEAPDKGKFVFSNAVKERLGGQRDLSRTLQVYLPNGDLYGGRIEGFVYVDAGARSDFGAELRTEGVNLSIGSMDIFHEPGAEGRVTGWTSFGGPTNDAAAIKGRGQFRVVDGRLKRLPVMAAILGAIANLRINAEERHIDGVFANFRIDERAFWIDEWDSLVISSPALRLRGKGHMTFDQELYLFLEPDVLTDYVPVVSQIVKSIKGVKLVGPLDAPVARWPILYEDVFRPKGK